MRTAIELMISKVEQHTQLEDSKLWWVDFKNEMLQKEKQQIIDAHESGFFRDGDEPTMRSCEELTEEANEYYNKTFKQP